MSEITKLIQQRLYNRDKDIQELSYEDPYFHYFCSSLRDIKEDNPEFILNFIIELCKERKRLLDNCVKLSGDSYIDYIIKSY